MDTQISLFWKLVSDPASRNVIVNSVVGYRHLSMVRLLPSRKPCATALLCFGGWFTARHSGIGYKFMWEEVTASLIILSGFPGNSFDI